GAPGHVRRVRPGEEAAFLAPLPLHLLPGDRAVLARLALLGLDCAGAVASLAVADMQRQFGPAGLAVHRLARGDDGEGVHAWTPPRTLAERLVLDGAVADLDALRHAARRLSDGLGERLQAGALAAVTLELHLEEDGGGTASSSRVLPAAAGNAAELWPAVLGMLGEARPQRPVAALRLVAGQLQRGGGRQVEMWRGGDARRDSVLRGAMRLQDRFGAGTVLQPRLAVDPGDLPERRGAWDRPGAAPPPPASAGRLRRAAARPRPSSSTCPSRSASTPRRRSRRCACPRGGGWWRGPPTPGWSTPAGGGSGCAASTAVACCAAATASSSTRTWRRAPGTWPAAMTEPRRTAARKCAAPAVSRRRIPPPWEGACGGPVAGSGTALGRMGGSSSEQKFCHG